MGVCVMGVWAMWSVRDVECARCGVCAMGVCAMGVCAMWSVCDGCVCWGV